MNFLNSKIKKYLCRLFAFIAPAMILTITFMLKRITPFGDNMIVSSDLEIQIVPFLTELSDKLRSGTSLMFSHRRTLGYDYICESAFYLTSPLNIFSVFFNAKTMPTFITLLLIVKSGLAGLTMNIYLNNHFNKYKNKDCIITIAFSSCYALCAYLTDYYILIMWLDVMIMLPLVILALESLIQYKKKYIYSIMLAIAIFCNYYIGFMLCIFVTLYFAYYLVAEYKANNYKDYLLIIKNFIIYSLLGGGLAAFILLPEIHALMELQVLHLPVTFLNLYLKPRLKSSGFFITRCLTLILNSLVILNCTQVLSHYFCSWSIFSVTKLIQKKEEQDYY